METILKIEDIEEVYLKQLEEGNQIYDTHPIHNLTKSSHIYDKIIKDEVEKCTNGINIDTVSGSDKISLKDLKKLKSGGVLKYQIVSAQHN